MISPNVEFRFGYVTENVDPTKTGKVKLVIPGFIAGIETKSFVRCIFPFGQKGALRKGQQVGCLIMETVPGSYVVVVLGEAYSTPGNKGSQAPGAQAPTANPEEVGVVGPEEYSRTSVTELDPDLNEIWVVGSKGSDGMAIVMSTQTDEITVVPGSKNVVLSPATQQEARVAVEGDPVRVESPDGPLYGNIIWGSAPMVARKIS